MDYNFDALINRENTDCVKYDLRKIFFGNESVIPMWVADMDFETPDFIIDALRQRLNHPVLGYTYRGDDYYTAIIDWLKSRHGWEVKKDWIQFSPGVVPALNMAVQAFTRPGDKVIIQPPVYTPFFSAVTGNGRILKLNTLKKADTRYEIDFANLQRQCAKGASLILISNPHNPGGMAWTKEELKELARICLRYGVIMVSDEIHCDLVNRGYNHTVLANISKQIARQTITMVAASKTFNLAGLSTASVIISDRKLRDSYKTIIQTLHIDFGNLFGPLATIAAYREGQGWLDALLDYINENINTLEEYLQYHIPQIKMMRPEATYMAWLDCSGLKMSDKALRAFFIDKAGLGLNPGVDFGKAGSGFMRINLACPRAVLLKGLDQLKLALNAL